jgi:steroid delta-isomerase-like uncharacterized protein
VTTLENKELIRRMYSEGYNPESLDRMGEWFGEDFVVHLAGAPEPVRGLAAYRQIREAFFAAFPDVHNLIEELIVEGDKVAVRERYRGTYVGEFRGVPPTGRAFEMASIDIYRVANGKIAEVWSMPDMLGLLRQLGGATPPDAVG